MVSEDGRDPQKGGTESYDRDEHPQHRPLVFSFSDRDVAADDGAGSLTVSELQETDGRVHCKPTAEVSIELDLRSPNLE